MIPLFLRAPDLSVLRQRQRRGSMPCLGWRPRQGATLFRTRAEGPVYPTDQCWRLIIVASPAGEETKAVRIDYRTGPTV